VVTWGLIGANVLVFLYELGVTNDFSPAPTESLFLQFGVVPYYILNALKGVEVSRLGTLVSSMFMHAGFLHIAGNMLYLFVFGGNVEDVLGRRKYLGFYLVAGIVGGLTQTFSVMNGSALDLSTPSVGASGAISGVLAAYLVFFPNARVVSLVGYFILPVKAYWFIGFWFLLQLLFSSSGVDTGVAYSAHLGGFASGLVLAGVARLFVKGRDVY
jgi:membrane associated rhomboid family serine protease